MKHTLIAIFTFFSLSASAQIIQGSDTARPLLLKYDTAIIIDLPPKFGLTRKAKFTGFFYNLESQELALRWRVTYYNDGQQISIGGVSSEDRLQVANNTTFVNTSGEIIDTATYQGAYFGEFDFYKMIAQRGTGANNATINELIIAAGMRPGRWKE